MTTHHLPSQVALKKLEIVLEQYLTSKAEQEKLEKTKNIPIVKHSNIIRCEAPVMKISSSFIRKAISRNYNYSRLSNKKINL